MASDLTLDTKKFNRQLAELGDKLKLDSGQLVRDETRKFATLAMRLTPPRSLAQGRKRVAADLRKIFTSVDQGFLNWLILNHGDHDIDTWITKGNGEKVHIKFDRIDSSGTYMRGFHHRQRGSRGRALVARAKMRKGMWGAAHVVSDRQMKRYTSTVQTQVGKLKSGWTEPLKRLGANVPGWVAKHGGQGDAQDNTRNTNFPQYTVWNLAKGAGNYRREMQAALNIRSKQMAANLRRQLRERAKQAGFRK